MKLLVVDDQGPVGAIISRIAQQGGWEALHTTNSENLAQTILRENIQVLMIDYLLEEESSPHTGLTKVAELRAADIRIPVILFSGATHLIDTSEAAKLGVVRILDKPLSIQELRVSLNEARKVFLDGRQTS